MSSFVDDFVFEIAAEAKHPGGGCMMAVSGLEPAASS
jgi:hypothetical protein